MGPPGLARLNAMATRYLPLFLKHSATPRIEAFALLAGLEAAVRGVVISVMPLAVYDAVKDAGVVSRVYFLVGIASLIWGLMVPWATRHVPRRWMYTVGCVFYMIGATLAASGAPLAVTLALGCMALATATVFVCFNAYVLDYVARAELGRTQSLQMLYAAAPWAVGPMLGVWLRSLWQPLPFVVAGGCAVLLLTAFWILRLGNGKQITRAKGPALNPLAYLGRFFAQPRLIAGWLFAVLRSCGWWVYVVYLPIFCIEAGLGDKVGGVALSLSNALLFISPFMLRLVYRTSVRRAVRGAFALCCGTYMVATLASGLPWVTVAMMMLGSFGLVMLDAAGGLPFMMSVKPSERTEMAAVYSSFRDVSGILTPGAAYLVLLVAPLSGIFAAAGAGMAIAWTIAGQLHPRLGAKRPSHGGVLPD
ncbi:MFS transporter [Rhodobacter ferrooxidans]|uniref:Major facilitator superfamily MFS_1 n=1 Tax=Rhodobacter ferrooxidans TaxID=371731 RepID=C8S2J4_9RHOB|nr:MFS transporter [Rhodobacter sp. SW2]EEW24865.1 major facilitator superfamily MFS_1 [Rhodobacter sp. SW2]